MKGRYFAFQWKSSMTSMWVDRGLLAQSLYFMNRIINRPVLHEGSFIKDYIDREKENLGNRIRSLINDKIQYSLERCIQEMCRDEKYSR